MIKKSISKNASGTRTQKLSAKGSNKDSIN